jgi:hypothetical protein
MDWANINIKMEIIFKETTLKMKKEETENIIFSKEESYNLSLILYLPKFRKFIFPMDLYISENKKTDLDRAPEKQRI